MEFQNIDNISIDKVQEVSLFLPTEDLSASNKILNSPPTNMLTAYHLKISTRLYVLL
jgi:hypothetical protein